MAKKLLVADDSLTIQKVIKLALSNEGYQIQAVSDGKDALQQISVFRPDVILIDVSLPNQSAFEVKRAVNRLADLLQVRFILMSSAFEKVDEVQAAEVGFHGRLTKPFDPGHLRQVLHQVLSEGTPPLDLPPPPPTFKIPSAPNFLPPPQLPESPLQLIPPGSDLGEWENLPPPPAPPGTEPDPLWDREEMTRTPMFKQPDSPETDPDSIPAPPHLGETGDIKSLTESTIRMSGLGDFDWNVQEPSMKPLQNMHDDGGSNFEMERSKQIHTFQPMEAPLITEAPKSAAPTSHLNLQNLEHDMSETIRREISRILPEIAERVIKEEIHRLLSEAP